MGWISAPCSPDYPPGEQTHRAVPGPRRPVLFLLSRVLSLHSSDSSLISPLQIAGGFPRHASRREEPASIPPLGPVHLLPSLFALLSAALPGRTIHHTHICLLPVPPPKPQRWQYLCLSPSLSFSLTQPSVCPLYSTSWILMFFVSFSLFSEIWCAHFFIIGLYCCHIALICTFKVWGPTMLAPANVQPMLITILIPVWMLG